MNMVAVLDEAGVEAELRHCGIHNHHNVTVGVAKVGEKEGMAGNNAAGMNDEEDAAHDYALVGCNDLREPSADMGRLEVLVGPRGQRVLRL
jgi:hypothetical protein